MKHFKKIELLANVAIIVVAALLGVVLVRNYLWPATNGKATPPDMVTVGKKLNVPGVDWAANKRTLLLTLQTGCHFCTDSAPFYKELAKRQAERPDLKLVAILPSPVADSKAYLDSLGVSVQEVRQARLEAVGVGGTPTLLLVDSAGVVTGVWRGQLDSAREAELLAQL